MTTMTVSKINKHSPSLPRRLPPSLAVPVRRRRPVTTAIVQRVHSAIEALSCSASSRRTALVWVDSRAAPTRVGTARSPPRSLQVLVTILSRRRFHSTAETESTNTHISAMTSRSCTMTKRCASTERRQITTTTPPHRIRSTPTMHATTPPGSLGVPAVVTGSHSVAGVGWSIAMPAAGSTEITYVRRAPLPRPRRHRSPPRRSPPRRSPPRRDRCAPLRAVNTMLSVFVAAMNPEDSSSNALRRPAPPARVVPQ
mmetsp:Transcript_9957/g.30649  ORF Transcript_9957/g.30649 Transcript_9957/m.30649 type:complete len:255 (+) Transcript_9957:2451-3215(+)